MLYSIISGFIIPVRFRFYFLVFCALILGVVTVLYIVSLIRFMTRKKVSKLSLRFGNGDDSAEKDERRKFVVLGVVVALLWAVCIVVL